MDYPDNGQILKCNFNYKLLFCTRNRIRSELLFGKSSEPVKFLAKI